MRIILAFLAALLFTVSANAQTTDSESANITANVIASLSLAKNQDLAFGDVAQNTSSTINVTDAAAVKFTVTGEPSTNVTFSLTSPANLTNGGNNLTFSDDTQYNTTDDAATANALNDNDTIALSGAGNLYVYLGGTVTAGAAQVTGAYSGTYTVQVDY